MRVQVEVPQLGCVMLTHMQSNERELYYELYPIFYYGKYRFLVRSPITLGTIPMVRDDKIVINGIAAINVALMKFTDYQFRFTVKKGVLGEKDAMIVCQLAKSYDENYVVGEWCANTNSAYIKANNKLITFKVNERLWKSKRGTMIREDNGMTVPVVRMDEIWNEEVWGRFSVEG